ncbi:sigma-70 family RNA polymerase sigma factor [Streptomyces sp. NPDC059477]|uniref:sigma-70 family RNA polymerase sigma factor n=1 Tax=Streptomyces sp. NPDC059477 TaxID=3346847 RepID=UPI0036BD8451
MSDFSSSGSHRPGPFGVPSRESAVVRAAQADDQRALDALVSAYLPLIYNIVGRALNAPSDTDDVVQDVMLEMVRDVGQLRDPEAFRSWLVAIAMRQVRRYWRLRRAEPEDGGDAWLRERARLADPGSDFADLTVTVLQLSDQRRETAEATRWLDAGDRELLAVWWMEVAGQLSRAELAAALEIPRAQAGVRVQRMKAQLEVARAVIRALETVPRCPGLDRVVAGWDGRPAELWRKRIARHIRECAVCEGVFAGVVPAERLLADLALMPVPPVLLALTAGGLLAAAGASGGDATALAADSVGPFDETTRLGLSDAYATNTPDAAHGSPGTHHTVDLSGAYDPSTPFRDTVTQLSRTPRGGSAPAAHAAKASIGKIAGLTSLAAACVAGVVIAAVSVVGPDNPVATAAAPGASSALSAPATASASPSSSTSPSISASASPSTTSSPSGSAAEETRGAAAPQTDAAPAAVTGPDTELPVRAAFYYPWYTEDPGADGGSQYNTTEADYNQDEPATIERQIKDMQYAGLQAGIASWWGEGRREDVRMPMLMSEGAELDFSWTVYYESEAYANPTAGEILSDLEYLRTYSDQPTWMHIDGKPVIFVYSTTGDACDMVDRWTEANRTAGYYVVLKVFGGYRDCANQPEGWHQYASSLDIQKGYSAVFSPGFYKNDAAAPVDPRDLDRFRSDVIEAATSGAPFQLLVSYNEWGEGTNAESATDWPSDSGHGDYMDVLHEVFSQYPR